MAPVCSLFLASLIVNAASNVSAADKTALEIDAETKFLKKLWLRIEHFLQGLDLSSYLLSMMVSSCAVWGGMVSASPLLHYSTKLCSIGWHGDCSIRSRSPTGMNLLSSPDREGLQVASARCCLEGA